MKSAYELAMERLEKQSPTAKLSEEQRAAIAEIESTYKAKIAERELFLQDQLQKAVAARDAAEADAVRLQLFPRDPPLAGRVRGKEDPPAAGMTNDQ